MSLISFIFIIYIHTSIHCIDIKRYFRSFISHRLFRSIYITLICLTSFRRQNFYKADISNQCQIHSRNPVFFLKFTCGEFQFFLLTIPFCYYICYFFRFKSNQIYFNENVVLYCFHFSIRFFFQTTSTPLNRGTVSIMLILTTYLFTLFYCYYRLTHSKI